MFNKFQDAVKAILEDNSVGDALGSPLHMIYNPNSPTSTDSYMPNYSVIPKLLSKKPIKRRNPELLTFKKRKKRKNKKKHGKSK